MYDRHSDKVAVTVLWFMLPPDYAESFMVRVHFATY